MPIVDLVELPQHLRAGARLLGLDVGQRRVGLALSDVGHAIASPLSTLHRSRFAKDAEALRRLVAKEDVGGLILGLPVEMDGREGSRCQSVRQFAANLHAVMNLPMAFWDERLSTMAVERMLIGEADMTRRRRASVVDKLAAAYILQGALDSLAQRPQSHGR